MSVPPILRLSRNHFDKSLQAIGVIAIALAEFLAWRFVRPKNIYDPVDKLI